MNIPVPFNLVAKIAKWIWDRATKVLLYKVYSHSHRNWTKRVRLGARWKNLGEHLEYSVKLAQPTDPEPRVSRLAIRATSGRIKTLDLFFEASGNGLRYQEKISAYNVDTSPLIWNMTNIPMQMYLGGPDEIIRFSIDEYQIVNCVVTTFEGHEKSTCYSERAYLSHSWFLNDDWVWRWGSWWNCNSIKFAKGEIHIYWRLVFGGGHELIYSRKKMKKLDLFRLFRRTVGYLMSLSLLVRLQFWMAIWSGLYVLDSNDRLRLRWRKSNKGRDDDRRGGLK